jgi:hypothetical protein
MTEEFTPATLNLTAITHSQLPDSLNVVSTVLLAVGVEGVAPRKGSQLQGLTPVGKLDVGGEVHLSCASPSPEGRGSTATGAFTGRRGPGEGSLAGRGGIK